MARISTHNGSQAHRHHNNRTEKVVAKESHIDPARPHEVWLDINPREAYQQIFGQAIEEYNARQRRADRKVTDYYGDICRDAKKHPVYEMIIGVYGAEVKESECHDIMMEFARGWQDRNPNLKLIGAYYHADEQGKAPHVHIDYVPVAHGYKKGPETQTGLVRALGEQGFTKHGRDTAQIQWERRENAVLEKICRDRGISVEHPQAGKGVDHLHTEAYKAQKELERVEGERLEALRGLDGVRADAKVQKAVQEALKGVKTLPEGQIEVLSESPAKTSLWGREMPATVTVRKDDFERAESLRSVAERTKQAAVSMERSAKSMERSAKVLERNKIDSHEVAVDSRVQQADRAIEKAQRAEREARSAEQFVKQKLEQVTQELQQVKGELQQMYEVTAFYPEDWEQMVNRTAKARELESLYNHAQDGTQDPRVNDSWGRTVFTLSDGQTVGYRGLLEAYAETCEANGIPHDERMWEHRDNLISREYDIELER